MIRSALVVAAAAISLSGCMSMSRSETLSPLSADLKSGGRVTEVTLVRSPDLKVTPAFDDLFKARVMAKLAKCATGDRPLRLEARIDRLSKANPVMTAVVMGSNVLRGSAKLVDAGTGEVVADYKVGQTVVGGRVAVIVMAEAEEQLSDAFGEEMCKQAFKPNA